MRRPNERTVVWIVVLAAAIALAAAASLDAQERSAPRGHVGLSFVAGSPVGDLGSFFDRGFGGQLEASWALTEDRTLRLRGDAGVLVYGHERIQYCYTVPVGCRVEAELTTTNNIFYVGAGPEVAFDAGAFEPYVYGTAGLSYFATISSLGGGGPDWAETTNYDDVVMALRVGGGMRLRVSGGGHPVSLDFGVERHQNGIARFLTEGDIVDNPDGSITLFPNQSEANLLTFRAGISVGFGGGDDRDRHRRRGRRR